MSEAETNQIQPNRNSKASVFEDLFSDRENLLALYHVLHPEDTTATVDDLQHITLKNILTRGQYNDLGFVVGNRLMILVEAQSTWSPNIIPRCIMYLAETWNRYFIAERYDIYSTSPVQIPEPELYVIYTGKREITKDVITLSGEFFDGKQIAIDAAVKVLKYDGGTDIIDQYIQFCNILDEQRVLYPQDGLLAIRETIRICQEAHILEQYLEKRKEEVIRIMTILYNQEQATQMMLANVQKEVHASARAEGLAEGKAAGEVTQAKKTAKTLFSMNFGLENIAKAVGYPVDTVKQWLGGLPA